MKKVIAYVHTHWDREWYRPFQEYRLRLIEVVDKAIDDLESGNIEQFYFDGQTIALDDYLEIFPEKEEKIKSLIKDKKIMVGPWYILPDEFLVSGESLIRNLLIGINDSKKYGSNEFVGYLPDAFGHIANMPRILKSFNIDNAIVWRGPGEQKTEFIWKSPDSSSILTTYLIEGYFQDILQQEWDIAKKAECLKLILDKISEYSTSDTILLPVGADHYAPPVNLKQQIAELNELLEDYDIQSATIFDYINEINSKNLELSEIKDELRDNTRNFILPGTLSSRLYIKRENAISNWKFIKLAEPFQALLESTGLAKSRKNQLEYGWKLLLKNHPHDSICGCSIDEVHDEMMPRYAQLNQISDGIIARCFRDIGNMYKKGGVILYNASDYSYTGVIKIKSKEELPENIFSQKVGTVREFPQEILYNILKVPVQEDMTEFNEYLVWVEDLKPHTISVINELTGYSKVLRPVEVSTESLENSEILLKVNKDGTINIKNRSKGLEFNNIHIFEDRADVGDTYNFEPLKNDIPVKATLLDSKIVESGGLRGKIRLHYAMDLPACINDDVLSRSNTTLKHNIYVDISLSAQSEMVEFEAEWENQSKDHTLQLKFKLPEKVTSTISEDSFGLIERSFDPDYSLRNTMPAGKAKELKYNTAPMQRFVWSQGLGIITEGLSEYGVDDNELYITLLRSVGILSKGVMNVRGQAAGPPLLTPGAQCIGPQKAKYALVLTHNPEELFKTADIFMGCILSQTATGNETKHYDINLYSLDNTNIYTYAVKKPVISNDKKVVARLMNISDKEQEVSIQSSFEISEIYEANSLEEVQSNNLLGKKILFKPYELKSIIINYS